jgi:DNA-binding CsgD family transcriptional regulator
MEKDLLLNEVDVRRMVKLLGDSCVLKGTLDQKKQFLMRGLCELIDLQAWAWVHAVEMTPGKLPVYVAFVHGGFSPENLATFIKIQTHPEMALYSTSICREVAGRTTPITRTLKQLVPLPEFYQAAVGDEWRACGVYPGALSFHPLADGTYSGIAMYRDCAKSLFSDRDAKIAHILLSEVPWLHAAQGPHADQAMQVPQLPVRQRLVLELLIQGYSRKSIAHTMDVSINTVAGYAKEIYSFFAVKSHTELINRFFLGNGGDKD